MDPTTLLGSRLTQLGLAAEIDRVERAQGPFVARRRATEALYGAASTKRMALARR